MDYKEKLEEAKRLYETATADQKYLLESLFPELKSKANERIRANCIHFLNLQKSHHASTVEIDECIDWLEKQCEQRSVETIEPKFKVGDWVVNNNGEPQFFQVTERSWPDSKIKRAEDILGMFINTATLDDQYHLWTISDAKNGDVLATDDWVFIFEKIRSNGKPVCYCHYDVYLGFVIDVNTYISTGSTIRPATEEQWNLLYQKMKEAGYEWDAEKKELKKIEQKSDSYCRENCKGFQETGKCFADGECKAKREAEQTPAWSEEDERNLEGIIDEIEANKNNAPDYDLATYDRFLSWLKSLKDRYAWKPSEEQMEAIDDAIKFLGCTKKVREDLKSLYEQLKKL